MKRRRQPFFSWLAVAAVVACAAVSPLSLSPSAALELMDRIWFNAVSIVLAAGPFVLAGAVAAFVVTRLRLRNIAALLAAALAPGCDCSINGFASVLARSPAPLAGAAIVWGAACNPIALATTVSVFGWRLAIARAVGAAAAALAIWLSWRLVRNRVRSEPSSAAREPCHRDEGILEHFERGLWALLPAAMLGAALPALLSARSHVNTPLIAALLGAALSPCSSADPVLASVFAREAPAQAAFMLASQCADVRLLAIVYRHFGLHRTLFAAIASALGCTIAALAAR